MQCCQSVRAEKETIPNSSSHRGVRGNTFSRFTPPLNSRWHDPYAESPSVLHTHHPVSLLLGGKWKESKSWSKGLETSLTAKSNKQKQLVLFPCFFEGLWKLKKSIKKSIGFSINPLKIPLTPWLTGLLMVFFFLGDKSLKYDLTLSFFLFVGTFKCENQGAIWMRQ